MRAAWKIGIPGTASLMSPASGTKRPAVKLMFGTTAAWSAYV